MRPVLAYDLEKFRHSLQTNRLFDEIDQAYPTVVGRPAQQAERDSWVASLPRLLNVFDLANLPDGTFVGIEVQIPYYSERIDVVLYGLNRQAEENVVLIELKQWSHVDKTPEGVLEVRMRTGLHKVIHPSAQVGAYRRHVGNFAKAFHTGKNVHLHALAYLHNYKREQDNGRLFGEDTEDLRRNTPTYAADDAEALAEVFWRHVREDSGKGVFRRVLDGGLGPSKMLVNHASEMISRQGVFTLLDEQIAARDSIVRAVRNAIQRKTKTVVLIDGGPGTGKSVIALDSMGEALRKDQGVYLVSGSAAFTQSLRQLLGKELAGLVRFTDYFWNFAENDVDVLVVDEAHRIRNKSQPRVPKAERPTCSQLEELIRAARVTVLFMDVNQIINPDEVGSPDNVRDVCQDLGVRFVHHKLRSQFRCDGSDSYLHWADDFFELTDSPHGQVLHSPGEFDLEVMDSPHELLAWVQEKNAQEPNSARLLAGWCWPWSDPLPDRTLVKDIVIGDFQFPWELKNGKKGLPGIPQAKLWAIVPEGADQVGSVYSVQGFEFSYVGVILGPDLVRRDACWVVNPRANYRNSLRAKTQEVASPFIRRIYRALLTRPMKGARVYSVDAETRDYLRSRIQQG